MGHLEAFLQSQRGEQAACAPPLRLWNRIFIEKLKEDKLVSLETPKKKHSLYSLKVKCLSFLHCKCQSCAHRHTFTPWWVYSPVCVWISALLSTCAIFALFIARTLLPSCPSGLRSPGCPLVLLLLRGENTFSSRFDTIDLNPVQGCLIFTFSLHLCLPIAFSPCNHTIIQLLL